MTVRLKASWQRSWDARSNLPGAVLLDRGGYIVSSLVTGALLLHGVVLHRRRPTPPTTERAAEAAPHLPHLPHRAPLPAEPDGSPSAGLPDALLLGAVRPLIAQIVAVTSICKFLADPDADPEPPGSEN